LYCFCTLISYPKKKFLTKIPFRLIIASLIHLFSFNIFEPNEGYSDLGYMLKHQIKHCQSPYQVNKWYGWKLIVVALSSYIKSLYLYLGNLWSHFNISTIG